MSRDLPFEKIGDLFIILENAEFPCKELKRQFPDEFAGKRLEPKGVRVNYDLYVLCDDHLYDVRLENAKQTLYKLPLRGIYCQIAKLIRRDWSKTWEDNLPMIKALIEDYLRENFEEDPCTMAFVKRQREVGKKINGIVDC